MPTIKDMRTRLGIRPIPKRRRTSENLVCVKCNRFYLGFQLTRKLKPCDWKKCGGRLRKMTRKDDEDHDEVSEYCSFLH